MAAATDAHGADSTLPQLPPELQLAVIEATLEPVVAHFDEDEREIILRNRDVLLALTVVCKLWHMRRAPS